jgi:DNA repair photolyase
MKFNVSKVGDYASHNLSIWYGTCHHTCRYCYVKKCFSHYKWASGALRINPKAIKQCKYADFDDVKCLIIQFSGDPLPISNFQAQNMKRLKILMGHLYYLELRGIPTKVLTKNPLIHKIIKYHSPYEHIQFGLSITTDSENTKETSYWEPYLPSIAARLDALEILHRSGFHTWASMEPVLPRTNIHNAILEVTDTGIEELWVGKGSYDKRLETAFHWGAIANQIRDLSLPQVHLKKNLRAFLKTTYFCADCGKNLSPDEYPYHSADHSIRISEG